MARAEVDERAGRVLHIRDAMEKALAKAPEPVTAARPDLSDVAKRAASENSIQSWLSLVGVPKRARELPVDDRRLPLEPLKAWVSGWRSGASIILAGPTGSGKTIAAVAALRMAYLGGYPDEEPRFRQMVGVWRAPSCWFVKAGALYQAVFEKSEDVLAKARRCEILVIDDWGADYEHDWPLSQMERLVDDRWDAMKSTIVTTNQSPESFSGSRSLDRLCDSEPGMVVLDRPSLRGRYGL